MNIVVNHPKFRPMKSTLNRAVLDYLGAFDWQNVAACIRFEIIERDTVFDARGQRLGWLDELGRPVLEFAPGDYAIGDDVEYFDRFGQRLGSLAFTPAALSS